MKLHCTKSEAQWHGSSKGENLRYVTRGRWNLITHQMGGVLCRNSSDLVVTLICGREKMSTIAGEKLAK